VQGLNSYGPSLKHTYIHTYFRIPSENDLILHKFIGINVIKIYFFTPFSSGVILSEHEFSDVNFDIMCLLMKCRIKQSV
jgi:hypothetical protein